MSGRGVGRGRELLSITKIEELKRNKESNKHPWGVEEDRQLHYHEYN